jgi:hypothetical protein
MAGLVKKKRIVSATKLTKQEESIIAQELHHDPEYVKLSVGGCCVRLNSKAKWRTLTRAQKLLKRPIWIEGADIRWIYEKLFNS